MRIVFNTSRLDVMAEEHGELVLGPDGVVRATTPCLQRFIDEKFTAVDRKTGEVVTPEEGGLRYLRAFVGSFRSSYVAAALVEDWPGEVGFAERITDSSGLRPAGPER